MIYSILQSINEYPKYIQFTGGLYLLSIFGVSCYKTYSDSKLYLNKYYEKKLLEYEKKEIKNAWSAVVYGAERYWWKNIVDSIIWPFSLSKDIIPWIVLKLNNSEPISNDNCNCDCDCDDDDNNNTNTNRNSNNTNYKTYHEQALEALKPTIVKPIPGLQGPDYNPTEFDKKID